MCSLKHCNLRSYFFLIICCYSHGQIFNNVSHEHANLECCCTQLRIRSKAQNLLMSWIHTVTFSRATWTHPSPKTSQVLLSLNYCNFCMIYQNWFKAVAVLLKTCEKNKKFSKVIVWCCFNSRIMEYPLNSVTKWRGGAKPRLAWILLILFCHKSWSWVGLLWFWREE